MYHNFSIKAGLQTLLPLTWWRTVLLQRTIRWIIFFVYPAVTARYTKTIDTSINQQQVKVKYSVLKISASRQYVQNCREFSPSGTISHHLRFSAGAGWSVHSSARSETLSIPPSVFILSKSFEILSPARQWSSWVRCQVLKYCLDLSICLFNIIPHFDCGVTAPVKS